MKYRYLGRSGLLVSRICLGTMTFGNEDWGCDQQTASKIVDAFVDAGGNFIDTADLYSAGVSEQMLGKAIAGKRRDELVIATKCWFPTGETANARGLSRKHIEEACDASLERLGTDYIDLYQIHWPEPPGDADAVAETLEKLRTEGKIRFVGVSNFGPVDLSRYPSNLFVSNQLAYSAAFRAIEFHLLAASLERGMSIITYSTLLHGVLTGKYANADEVPPGRARTRHFSAERDIVRHGGTGHEETLFSLVNEMRAIADEANLSVREVAMLWVLAQEGVATILAGSRNAAQAKSNAEVGDLSLDPQLVARLTRASEPLKEAMGPNPDMWQRESRVKW